MFISLYCRIPYKCVTVYNNLMLVRITAPNPSAPQGLQSHCATWPHSHHLFPTHLIHHVHKCTHAVCMNEHMQYGHVHRYTAQMHTCTRTQISFLHIANFNSFFHTYHSLNLIPTLGFIHPLHHSHTWSLIPMFPLNMAHFHIHNNWTHNSLLVKRGNLFFSE